MKNILFLLMAIILLTGCSMQDHRPKFSLNGTWVMTQVTVPEGYVYEYPADEGTSLRVYVNDSMMYECHLTQTEQALVVKPMQKSVVTLIDKGNGEHLYLEGEDPRPLVVLNDSAVTIQRMGRVSEWHRSVDIEREWGQEILAIVEKDLQEAISSDDQHNYVLSAKEREQASVIHNLIYAIIAIIVLAIIVAQLAISNRRAKQRLQLQLQQILEEHDERPQPVRQAIASVEEAYFSSEDYRNLQRRFASGQRLNEEMWTELETQLKKVYPGFTSQLRNLYPMSELEYQTNLLIKLRIAPKDIATVLSRDMSTISTIRSRLYQKVFGHKGSTKEWDDFVLSIGA